MGGVITVIEVVSVVGILFGEPSLINRYFCLTYLVVLVLLPIISPQVFLTGWKDLPESRVWRRGAWYGFLGSLPPVLTYLIPSFIRYNFGGGMQQVAESMHVAVPDFWRMLPISIGAFIIQLAAAGGFSAAVGLISTMWMTHRRKQQQ